MSPEPKFCFITDPLVTTAGSVRPALLLSKELAKRGYSISIVTTKISENILKHISQMGHEIITIGPKTSYINSMPNLDAWLRHIIKNNTCHNLNKTDFIINTSSTSIMDADIYYAQGIMMKAIEDMISELSNPYKIGYSVSKGILNYLEKRTIKKYEQKSKLFVANSDFCANMYQEWGIRVDDVINPPLDTSFFKPSTQNPLENYILTYFGTMGKESNYSIIKKIADSGIRIKVFGETPLEKELLHNRNIDFLGKVSDEHLVELYTNALLTLFAFKHEPFGYIPVESLSCGTPVLTYRKQGPSETVTNQETGWLVESDDELLSVVKKIWKNGISKKIRKDCIKSVEKFSVNQIADKWVGYINEKS